MRAVIIGAGAAGCFAAIQAKENNPSAQITILEQAERPLAKLLLTGGGRCNLTNNGSDPRQLAKNYPRGSSELIGPFLSFGPNELMAWFESRGVPLKTEAEGRVFPLSNRSETIATCLLNEIKRLGIPLLLDQQIASIARNENSFHITTSGGSLSCDALLLATGSHPSGYQYAAQLGHTLHPPIPSLFSFHLDHDCLKTLSGVTVDSVSARIIGTPFAQQGPLLITHEGVSGPAILKLSAWAARYLHDKKYRCELSINWLPALSTEEVFTTLLQYKQMFPQKQLCSDNPFSLPKTLWRALFGNPMYLRDYSYAALRALTAMLHDDRYSVTGKSINTSEFVTCGGVSTKEIHWKTMESRLCPSLYFAGEILDIDGITGGFNLQNAWTTGFIAGRSLGPLVLQN